MPSLNKVMIIGNIGSDPEMRFTPSGKPTTIFRVAVNNRYKGSDGESKEETEWFSVTTWGRTAELCNQYLHKGSLVYVEGRSKTRSWEGQDGQKHWRTELVANLVLFMDRVTNGKLPTATDADADIDPGELPF